MGTGKTPLGHSSREQQTRDIETIEKNQKSA